MQKEGKVKNIFILVLMFLIAVMFTFAITTSLETPTTNGFTSASNISFAVNFSSQNITTANCTLYINTTLVNTQNVTANVSTILYSSLGVGEGYHTWNLTCTNPAYSAVSSEAFTVKVDRTNPTLSGYTPTSAQNIPSSIVAFNWTVHDDLADGINCSLIIDDVLNVTKTATNASANTTYSRSGIVDGAHTWNVSCHDNASNYNSAAGAFSVDTKSPSVIITSPVNGSTTNDNTTLSIAFTVTDLVFGLNISTVKVQVYDPNLQSLVKRNDLGEEQINCSSDDLLNSDCTITYTLSSYLTEGQKSIKINLSDRYGAQNNISANRTFIVDISPPAITTVALSDADFYISNGSTEVISVNSADDMSDVATVTLDITGTSQVSLLNNASGLWNGTLIAPSTEGWYNLTIIATDSGSNTQTNTSVRIYVDATAPDVNWSTPVAGEVENGAGDVICNFTGIDVNITRFNVTIIDADSNILWTAANTTRNLTSMGMRINLSDVSSGEYSIVAIAMDEANNHWTETRVIKVKRRVNVSKIIRSFATANGDEINMTFHLTNGTRFAGGWHGTDVAEEVWFESNITLVQKLYTLTDSTNNSVLINASITGVATSFNLNESDMVKVTVDSTNIDIVTPMRLGLGAQVGNAYDLAAAFFVRNMSLMLAETNYTNTTGDAQWATINYGTSLGAGNTSLFINDDTGHDVRVMGQCVNNAMPTTTPSAANVCYVNSSNDVVFYVPHLSGIAILNKNYAPNITINVPVAGAAVTDSFLNVSGNVYSADLNLSSCYYNLTNATNNSIHLAGDFFTPTAVQTNGTNYSFNLAIAGFKDLLNKTNYNVTIQCAANGNTTTERLMFNVSDTTYPLVNAATVSVSSTTATLTMAFREYVKVGLTRGASATAQTSNSTTFGETHSFALASLSAATTYYYNITACDRINNCNNTGVFSFTTSAAASSSSSSSSSSGGGVTVTSTSVPSGITVTYKWNAIASGASGLMSVNNPEIPITKLEFTPNTQVKDVELKVTKLTDAPMEADTLVGNVYKHIKITKSNVEDADIKEAKIKFKVKKSWLTESGIDENKVVLVRYVDGQWVELVTTKKVSGLEDVQYEAVTPGFSYFAIIGKTAEQTVESTTEPSEPTTTEPTTEPSEPAGLDEPEPTSGSGIAWTIAIIIVIILIIAYFAMKKKQPTKKK